MVKILLFLCLFVGLGLNAMMKELCKDKVIYRGEKCLPETKRPIQFGFSSSVNAKNYDYYLNLRNKETKNQKYSHGYIFLDLGEKEFARIRQEILCETEDTSDWIMFTNRNGDKKFLKLVKVEKMDGLLSEDDDSFRFVTVKVEKMDSPSEAEGKTYKYEYDLIRFNVVFGDPFSEIQELGNTLDGLFNKLKEEDFIRIGNGVMNNGQLILNPSKKLENIKEKSDGIVASKIILGMVERINNAFPKFLPVPGKVDIYSDLNKKILLFMEIQGITDNKELAAFSNKDRIGLIDDSVEYSEVDLYINGSVEYSQEQSPK